MGDGFKDHFSGHAAAYALYWPRYPEPLFAYLAGRCRWRALAWDCATGSGQAAVALAPHVERVLGTDASAAQLADAEHHPQVGYAVTVTCAPGPPSNAIARCKARIPSPRSCPSSSPSGADVGRRRPTRRISWPLYLRVGHRS